MIRCVLAWVTLTCSGAQTFSNQYYSGVTTNDAGLSHVGLLEQARRMLSVADTELMTPTGVYDENATGLVEGAEWPGNIWTQNTYGFGYASAPYLPDPLLSWLETSFLWWFDHRGDGGQVYGGLPDVPAGMLCDNGSPTGCNYMQCGPGRSAKLVSRLGGGDVLAATASNRTRQAVRPRLHPQVHEQVGDLGDTAALGHDFTIEGTLAGTLMMAEHLLATRNISGAQHYLPVFKQTSDFMETRRVQDDSPLTPGTAGLFFAGSGANLLAPGFGGQGLPSGCAWGGSCGQAGQPLCCAQRGFAYLAGLTVTYSAVLDRLLALEDMAFPGRERGCTRPNADTAPLRTCADLWRARREANDASLGGLMTTMNATGTRYLVQAIAPDGERYGEYAPRGKCIVDSAAGCAPATRHGYFETSPNADAVALRTVDADTARGIYAAMLSVEGLRPCAFTLSNFPDYDNFPSAGAGYGYGTWVSGGSWSTLEARVMLAHRSQGRSDLAAKAMHGLIHPHMLLFKGDNPIAHQGCGPGMYAQAGNPSVAPDAVMLTLDVFAIPAAFVSGLWGISYTPNNTLTLRPALPAGVHELAQKFPARWGSAMLFLTLHGDAHLTGGRLYDDDGDDGGGGLSGGEDLLWVRRVEINGTACDSCLLADGGVVLSWQDEMASAATAINFTMSSAPTPAPTKQTPKPTPKPEEVAVSRRLSRSLSGAARGGLLRGAAEPTPTPNPNTAATSLRAWRAAEAARRVFDPGHVPRQYNVSCAPAATLLDWAANATRFSGQMRAAGLGWRFEVAQADALLVALNVSVARCVGRADGSIAPLPKQPKIWNIYNMSYNQQKVENFFSGLPAKVWRGLVNTIASYDRSNANTEQKMVLGLFRGKKLSALRSAAAAAAQQQLDERIAVAEEALAALRAQRATVSSPPPVEAVKQAA